MQIQYGNYPIGFKSIRGLENVSAVEARLHISNFYHMLVRNRPNRLVHHTLDRLLSDNEFRNIYNRTVVANDHLFVFNTQRLIDDPNYKFSIFNNYMRKVVGVPFDINWQSDSLETRSAYAYILNVPTNKLIPPDFPKIPV